MYKAVNKKAIFGCQKEFKFRLLISDRFSELFYRRYSGHGSEYAQNLIIQTPVFGFQKVIPFKNWTQKIRFQNVSSFWMVTVLDFSLSDFRMVGLFKNLMFQMFWMSFENQII